MNPNEIFNVPFDLTQDGIASILGISRAHASLELKKLKEGGKADDWLAHIKGIGSKRKAYYLLPEGFSEAEQLKKRFESSGVMIDALLDMKRCDPDVMWESLSVKDRETFGLACVFRVSIPRKTLPDTNTGVIPSDFFGMISISDNVREKYLSVVDPKKTATWHSRAADWWMDYDDDQERLFHLVKAGRNTEACKLLVKRSEEFLGNPNEDLFAIVKEIIIIPKYTESVYSIRSKLAIDCNDAKDALGCAKILDEYGGDEPALIRAEADIISGKTDKALTVASKIFEENGSARSALIVAKCLFIMNRWDDADTFLDSAYKAITADGNVTRVDEILFLRAGIAYRKGKKDETLSYLNKASSVCKKDILKERIATAIDNIKEGREVRFN
jgi:Predicted transcriptional regulators